MILLVLSGCGSLGLQSAVEDSGVPLLIASVEPNWGPADVETDVIITGSGFTGAVSVAFGDYVVENVILVDANTIEVTAPAAGVEAPVDVWVQSDLGIVSSPSAFTYASEAPDDTGAADADTDVDADSDTDSDSDTDTSGAGKVGGLVQFSLVQIACPSCLGLTSSLEVGATAAFHDPSKNSWISWLPAEGSCAENPAPSDAASGFLDAGEWVYLTSGSRSVALRSASDAIYASESLDEKDFVRNAAYEITATEGGRDLSPFSVTDAFITPQAISTVEPYEMLYSTQSSAFSARVPKSRAVFSWSPSGGSGSFVILLDVYNGSSGAFIAEVMCRGPDNGSMTIPNGYLSFPSQSLLVIGMYRYVIDSFERPDNASTVETVINLGVLGTGVLQ